MNALPGTRRSLVLVVLLAAFTPAAGPAAADNSPDTTVVPIQGVTVTGSRVPETVLKSPAAITVVPRARITPTRQISIADGLQMIPGVFVQSRGGAQDVRITIRGYGARGNGERSNAGNMRGIRILTDGIPLTEPDGRTSLELIDLGSAQSIEVLRSNGSALYGNASGGVVNLRSALDFERPYCELQGRGGSFGFHREQGVLGYQLGPARAMTSIYTSNFDGWREHSGSATTSIQNRISAGIDERTRLGLLLDFVSNLNRYPGALTTAQLDADPEQANASFVARDERRFNRVGRVGLLLDRDLGTAQKLSIATWVEPKVLQRSERNRFRDFNRYHLGGNAVWQLQTAPGGTWKLNWTAGADEQFQDGSIQFYSLNPDGSRGTTLIANKREGANSAGGFVQGELVWNEHWAFRAAARYDNLWYISEDRIDPTINATKHFTQITPKGSIARYFDRHTVYAAVGGGVEAPAFNEIDPPPSIPTTSLNPFLDPMRSTSYEVGAKGELPGSTATIGRVGYDLALYWIDVRNDIVPYDGGAYFFTAGKSRRRGVELGLDWAPLSRISVAGAATVSRNEYREYANLVDDFAGNDVAGLPEVVFDGEARLRLIAGLSVSGSIKHVGRYFADDANSAEVDAFDLLGAQAEYVRPVSFGTLRAFVSGDNLADQDHVSSVFINGINGQFFEPGLPRNFSAGIGISIR